MTRLRAMFRNLQILRNRRYNVPCVLSARTETSIAARKTILRCSPAHYGNSIPAPFRILFLAGTMLRPKPRREHAKARVHRARWRRGCLRSTTMVRGAEAEPTNARDLMTLLPGGASLSNSVRT